MATLLGPAGYALGFATPDNSDCALETLSSSYHDVEDDAHAPDVRQLWDVGDFHENFRRRVRVAAAVGLAAFILTFDWT